MWLSDKRVELDGIKIYAEDIGLKIQWYDHITGVLGSDLVCRLHCANPP